jgi:hypothetical protein
MIGMLIFLVLAIITVFVHIFGDSSQIGTFLFLAILAIAAKIGGFVGSILIGFAGAPGALLARGDEYSKAYRSRRWAGLLLSAIGQCFVALIFVALTIVYVRHAISQPNTCPWILWIAGFLVAISPVKSSAEQSRIEEITNPTMVRDNVLHMALGFPCIVAPVAYLIFAFFPKTMRFFSWLPFVD